GPGLMSKVCTKRDAPKPDSNYYRDPRDRNGLYSRFKQCCNQATTRRRRANRAKICTRCWEPFKPLDKERRCGRCRLAADPTTTECCYCGVVYRTHGSLT